MSRLTTALLLAGGTALAVLGGVVTVLDGEPARPVITIPAGTPERTITGTSPAPQGVPVQAFGEGRHRVISDIAAGTYRTGGSRVTDWPLCTWKLLKGDRIIAGGTATGPTSIVIEPVYDAVQSSGCLEWRRVP